MLNVWKVAAEQLTPRPLTQNASVAERNPFDSITATTTPSSSVSNPAHSRTSSLASLRGKTSVATAAASDGCRTPVPRSPTTVAASLGFFHNAARAGPAVAAGPDAMLTPTTPLAVAADSSAAQVNTLKAPQTTSLTKASPADFTFTANPLSKAKNALRDSVSLARSASAASLKRDAQATRAKDAATTARQQPPKSPLSAFLPTLTTTPAPPAPPSQVTRVLNSNSPLCSSSVAAPAAAAPPPPQIAAPSSSGPNGSGVSTARQRGLLSVKLISARNLSSIPASRPYVVALYDNNEFVSREPIPEEEGEVRVKAAKRERIEPPPGTEACTERPPGSKGATRPYARESGPSTNGSLGPQQGLSGKNPLWKQQVDFDAVLNPKPSPAPPNGAQDITRTLHVGVYDRSIGDADDIEGVEKFLGEVEIPLDFDILKERNDWTDDWYSLVGTLDPEGEQVTGEVRLQIKYCELKSKRMDISDFEILRMIGKGTFGRVFQVRKRDTRRIYAMKVLSKKEVIAKKEVAHTIGERNILQRSSECPFLLGLKFSFQTPAQLFLVMDYKSGGELFHHLQREGRFTEERARFYTAEIVLAFEHLHKYDIVYRDLKPENILLDATGHVALCDFGLSKPDLPSDALTQTFCGTTEYLAPEVLLDDHGYSKLVDFWSLGVLLFEMCCGWSPFYAEDTQEMYRNICFGKIKFPRGVIGDDGKQFVKGLLNRNPRHRLGATRDAQELKEHAFFSQIDFVALEQRQITPPFKPFVDSDESVANFDSEFTEADIVKEMPIAANQITSTNNNTTNGNGNNVMKSKGVTTTGDGGGGEKFDEDDPSADWIGQASSVTNGANGMMSVTSRDRRRHSQDSMTEHFKGFSYAGDSEVHLSSKFGMTSIS